MLPCSPLAPLRMDVLNRVLMILSGHAGERFSHALLAAR
jgi:hypothetical protein